MHFPLLDSTIRIYSACWNCFIFIHPMQSLGGTYCAATKLKIKPGYWITACMIRQTLQFSVGSDWKTRQNLNTNKMFPRWASWIWRHITHNTDHNLFKYLHLLIRAREQLHEMLLKVKIPLVPCLVVHSDVQVQVHCMSLSKSDVSLALCNDLDRFDKLYLNFCLRLKKQEWSL